MRDFKQTTESTKRAILIHNGIYPQNSQGCLLLEERIGEENKLERGDSIIEKLRNEFKSQAFKEKFGSMPNAASHIMVMVENEFETKKQIINNEIPPNVIRIETQDNSEEFIEIILPEEEQDLWDKTLDTAQNIGSYVVDGLDIIGNIPLPQAKILKAPKLIRNGYNFAKKTLKLKSKYATRQEVLDVLEKKYKLKKENPNTKSGKGTAFMAKDNKQIKEIWKDITEGAEVLKDIERDSYGLEIKRRKISDNTILQLRKKSSSKGSAIEINKKDEKPIKIHNKAGEDGDW